jgi:hypothetical protein
MKQLPLHRHTYTYTSLDALSDAEAVAYIPHTIERRGGGHWAALLTPGFLDRGRSWTQGYCHLRPGSPSPRLAQGAAAVSFSRLILRHLC